MRRGFTRIGAPALLAVVLAVAGCGAADESSPVSLGRGPTAKATTAGPAIAARPAATTTRTSIPSAASIAAPMVDPYADSPLIDRTEWTDDPDGHRLRVYPSAAGRADTFAPALDRAWGEVLASAPDADTPGMYDQFKCHWQWARVMMPNKPSWNLEPWRPAVGYEATVQAMCNPGGPDPGGN
ncbi:DUF2599 domain-containing protein [Nocardia terpenica]|uniref:DUF2599 domain-containing protein n=1 Tax=Nocardia terpenica TaxID=455432 RepID=UPI001EEA6DFD|nr:DUF2599 domain-containing protein [Nocardia terpenica]